MWNPFAAIAAWLNPLLQKFRAFLAAIFKGALEQALAALRDIALQAVSQVAADPSLITDEAKRKAAFKIIADYAKTRGIAAGNSVINLAIELEVQYFKQQQPTA